MDTSSSHLCIETTVRDALESGKPVVALESAVLTHGLPDPHNIQAIRRMAGAIDQIGAVPALCLIADGHLHVGASLEMAETGARDPAREKVSVRDLGSALTRGITGGLTVSATLLAAHLAGIRVFATGGIGGVHRDVSASGDVSADLHQLARTPVITVCAGAKSVLDIPRTLEMLESLGVPVFGYRSTTFPAFYLLDSGVITPRVDTPAEVAFAARAQWDLGYCAGVIVANPIPASDALPTEDWRLWLEAAEMDAQSNGIRGKDVTPYLLDKVARASGGRTVQSNLVLLESNARLAAEIAVALSL